MSNKPLKNEDKQPYDYFKEVEAVKKQEKSGSDNLINALRSDMLPASSVAPASKNILQRLNLKIIGGVLIGLVILAVIWFSLAGPGRPILEQNLASLVNIKATSTRQLVPTPIPATNTPPQPSNTPLPSPTLHPTNTPTIKIIASATQLPATKTTTPTPACRDVSTITLADVGQTLCVQGKVIEIIDQPNNFMLIFSNKRGAFYWISYDIVWTQAELDTCYQIRGTIRKIANSPILVFNYSNLPEVCP
jgi:hypothetical protein